MEAAGFHPRATQVDAGFALGVELQTNEEGSAASGSLRLSHLAVRADGEECLALDELTVQIERWSTKRLDGVRVESSGLRARAQREPSGALQVFGLATAVAAATPPSGEESANDTAEPTASTSGFRTAIEHITIRDIDVQFLDGSVEPAAELRLGGSLDARPVVLGADDAPPMEVALALEAPALAEQIEIRAQLAPFAHPQEYRAEIAVGSLTLAALRPHLESMGWEPIWTDGQLRVQLEAQVHAENGGQRIEAALRDLELRDGEQNWLSLQEVLVEELELGDDGAVRLGRLQVGGGSARADLLAGNGFAAAGLRTLPPASIAAESSTEDGSPDTETLLVEALDLELSDLTLGGETPGRADLSLSLALRDLCDEIRLSGAVASGAGAIDLQADLKLAASNLRTTALDHRLRELGIESELKSGEFGAALEMRLRDDEGVWWAEGALRDVKFSTERQTWLELTRVELASVRASAERLEMGEVRLDGPGARIERDADGVLRIADLRFVGAPPPSSASTSTAPSSAPSPSEDGAPADSASELETRNTATVALGPLVFDGVKLRWKDRAVDPAVTTELTASGRFDGLDLGNPSAQSQLTLQLGVDEVAEQIAWTQQIEREGDRWRTEGRLEGRGLREGPLAAYLPSGIESSWEDGRVSLALHAAVEPNEDGGHSVEFRAEELELRDGETDAWARMGALRFRAPRVDPVAGVYQVDDLETEGVLLRTRIDDGGSSLLGFRVQRAGSAGPEPPENGDEPPAVASTPATVDSPDASGFEAAATEVVAEDPGERLVLPELRIESLRLGVDEWIVEDRREGRDEVLVASLELALTEPSTLTTPEPFDLPAVPLRVSTTLEPGLERAELALLLQPFAPEPRAQLAVEVRGVDGPALHRALPDLIETIDLRGIPSGSLTAALDSVLQVRRRGAVEVDVASGIGAELRLENVRFHADSADEPEVELDLVDVEVSRFRPDPAELLISRVEVRGARGATRIVPEGLEIAGVVLPTPPPQVPAAEAPGEPAPEDTETRDSDSNAESAVLESADSETAEGKTAEAESNGPENAEPVSSADGEIGVEPPLADQETPSDDSSVDGAAIDQQAREQLSPETETDPAIQEEQPEAPKMRVEIEELLVSGIAWRFEDTTVEPVLALPLEDIDLVVEGISTLALEQRLPIEFRLDALADRVDLPERVQGDSLLSGVLSATARAVIGSEDEGALEQRAWFDEVSVRGRLELHPHLRGFVRTDFRDVELLAFRGAALASGVEIGDGVMNSRVDVRFLGDEGMALESQTQFRSLSMSEPPDGPISAYLKLPAPLDTVLFLLRNEDGEQDLPVDFRLGPEGVSTTEIAKTASATLLTLITDAISAAPFRVTGSLVEMVDVLGLGEGEAGPVLEEQRLEFVAGQLAPPAERLGGLREFAITARREEARIRLEHSPGTEDAALAARLANPDRESLIRLSEDFRQQRDALADEHARLQAQCRLQLAVGDQTAADRTTEELRALQRERLQTEDALDRVLERLRPGAERRADRNAEQMLRALGDARLAALREFLIQAGLSPDGIRVRRAPPRVAEDAGPGSTVTLSIQGR